MWGPFAMIGSMYSAANIVYLLLVVIVVLVLLKVLVGVA